MPNYELAAERAARKAGINPRIFKAMIRAESNFNPNAGSSAGARGIAQFMPATAPSYGVNLNDGLVSDDLAGAAKYIKEALAKTGGDYRQALSMYNAGPARPNAYRQIPETIAYVRKIMDGYKTEQLKESGRPGPTSAGPRSRPTVAASGPDNRAARAALIQQFLSSRSSDPVAFAQQAAALNEKPVPTQAARPAPARRPARSGSFTVAPGANRAGVPMTSDIKDFLGKMTASGRSVNVGTGSNHSRMTADGNVSDHWEGNAADIPATGEAGDLIAAHAIAAAAGVPFDRALAMAKKGGIQNFQTPNGRVQVIWRAPGHFDHVHVGVKR